MNKKNNFPDRINIFEPDEITTEDEQPEIPEVW